MTNFASFEHNYLQTCKILSVNFRTNLIVDQQPHFSKCSLDVDSLFTNISLEETIGILKNVLKKRFKNILKDLDSWKTEADLSLKRFLLLNIKDSNFAFDGTLYKQLDDVVMDSPSGPLLVNAFLVYCNKKFG